MKRNDFIVKILAVATTLILVLGMMPAALAEGVTEVLVGTAAVPAPYGWIEADGSVGGYEQAVIKAVDEKLEDYTFSIEVTDFPSIFTGIDSGRYLLGANNISYTEAREEKYLYSQENELYNTIAVTFRKGRTDIQGAADLGGKKTVNEGEGNAFQLFLEKYNEEHPDNPVDITFASLDKLAVFQEIQEGALDFSIGELAITNYYLENFDLELESVILSEDDTYGLLDLNSYFIYPRTEAGEALRAAVDGALRELKDDGTISALSVEYFGFDMFADAA